ncbi:MAG TPA: hypothetical protein VHC46_03110 [Thermodesulfobacteriota bacterium]|nr:hypothetical protein [Thermodesulfobacteriota bacterium]
MTRPILPVLVLILAFASYARGAETPMPEGYGVVVDVDWPSEPGNPRFNVANGDVVTGRYGWYSPPGVIGPADYNVLIITKPINHARAYIVFEAINIDQEVLKKKLGRLEGEIKDVGKHEGALKPGDNVHITTEDFYGLTKINLSFTRGEKQKPVAKFYFVNHLVHPVPETNPAYPYIPYISEIQ